MNVTKRAFEIIEDGKKEILKLESELNKIGSLSDSDRKIAQEELNAGFVALDDAKRALLADKMDAFIVSFTVGVLSIGRADGMTSQAKTFSKLRSEYGKLRLQNDPKHFALIEIEREYNNNKSQFKRYGYSAEFIRKMANKYPIIQSQKTIENLVSKLNKKNEEIPR